MLAQKRTQMWIAALVVFAVAVAIIRTFFGTYAFDDSYVGYTYARNLLLGHGFSYNVAGSGTLSTSAPLAVPLYAIVALFTHHDVVLAAQLVSALAMLVLAGAAFALAARIATPFGSAIAAISLIASPLVVLVWSHETLLYLTALVLGIALIAYNRLFLGALAVGCAALFRGEALLALPFIFGVVAWQRGWIAFPASALSLVPFSAWAIYAQMRFGEFLSQTIAAKQAQALYPFIKWYVPGFLIYLASLLYLIDIPFVILFLAIVLLTALTLLAGRTRWEIAIPLFWFFTVTLFYTLLHIQFYFWFTTQAAVALSVLLVSWWLRDAPVKPVLTAIGRALALVILATELVLTIVICRGDARFQFFPWNIEPRLAGNSYMLLGKWFAAHAKPGERIGFSEFGQLRYYSNRDIIEYLGLVTPDAIPHVRQDDPMWTYERYKPEWIVETTANHLFVDPTEYDWFTKAYRIENELTLRAAPDEDPNRDRFILYRLIDPQAIPPADTVDMSVQEKTLRPEPHGLAVRFVPGIGAMTSVELRAMPQESCPNVVITLMDGNMVVAREVRSLHPGHAVRLTLTFPPLLHQAATAFTFTLRDCNIRPLPHPPLRVFSVFTSSLPAARPADAFRVFYRSGLSQ